MTLLGGTSHKTILAKGFIIDILQGLGSAPAFPVYFTYSGGGEKVVEVFKISRLYELEILIRGTHLQKNGD